MAQCRKCGVKGISAEYEYCYRCNLGRKNSNWHDPEYDIAKSLKSQDAEKGRSRFWVYVLETDCGHYVGHTGNLSGRMRDHKRNRVPSTAWSNPREAWRSFPKSSRDDVIDFEAALKSYRDSESPKFVDITGLLPIPFDPSRRPLPQRTFRSPGSPAPQYTPAKPRAKSREFENKGGWKTVLGIIVAIIIALYVLTFDSEESTDSATNQSLDKAEEHDEQLRLRREFYRIRDEILNKQQKQ